MSNHKKSKRTRADELLWQLRFDRNYDAVARFLRTTLLFMLLGVIFFFLHYVLTRLSWF